MGPVERIMLLETLLAVSLALFLIGGWLLRWSRVGFFASLHNYQIFNRVIGSLLAVVLGWLGFYLITGQRPPPPRLERPVMLDVILGAQVLLSGLVFLGSAGWLAWRKRHSLKRENHYDSTPPRPPDWRGR